MRKNKIIGILLLTVLLISATTISKKLIKWNFNDYTKLTYEYNQTISTDGEYLPDTQKMLMTANLLVSIKNKEFADVIFTDIKQIMLSADSLGVYKATDTIEMPNQVLFQDLKADGDIDGDIQQSNAMLTRTLFPITNKKMKIGDTVDLKMSMPFNVMGTSLNVKGYNRVKYTNSNNGIENLKTTIDVSDYTIPEEIKQEYVCYLKGKSDFYFDSNKGIFNNGTMNMNIAMGINIADSTSTEKDIKMMLNMTTEINLKLMKTE